MSRKQKLFRVILPIIIIAAGAVLMATLISQRPSPKKTVKTERGTLVRTLEVAPQERTVVVRGTGTVKPRRAVSVVPQVSGQVTRIATGFAAGAFFKRGDLLFEIEESDYRLAIDRARAERERALYELTIMESRAEVARLEWERLMGEGESESGTSPNPLVLYGPQLKNARASMTSAEAMLARAKLDLERTRLRAPFNCRVRSEEIDVGQYVKAGAPVAALSGTDYAEITVPLSLDELRWLSVPDSGGAGSSAAVTLTIGKERHRWQGVIDRSLGEVDPSDRMMRVVVRVKDPYGLGAGAKADARLAQGAFVEVELTGKTLAKVFIIPRSALRDGNTVWMMDADLRLAIRDVTPLRAERDTVIIGEGLERGDRVVLTTLSGAVEGMKLREASTANTVAGGSRR